MVRFSVSIWLIILMTLSQALLHVNDSWKTFHMLCCILQAASRAANRCPVKSEDEDDSTADDGSTTSYTTVTSDTDDKGDTDHKRKSSPSKSFRLKDGSDDDVLSLSSESAIPRRMNVRMRGARGRPTRAAHRLKIRFQSTPLIRARGPGRPRGVRASRPRGRPPLRGRVLNDDAAGRSATGASTSKNSASNSKRRFVSRAGRGGGRVGLSSGRVHRPVDSDSDVKHETVDNGLSMASTTATLPVTDSAETSKQEAENSSNDRLVCNGTGPAGLATNGHAVGTTTTSSESGDHEPSMVTPPVDTRTFWRPPEEARPILDQVFITDVTANRVTVTVRESHTDAGFFRKREVDN